MALRRCVRISIAGWLLLSGAATAVAASPQVNGRLEKIGPFRVLRVWGSPREMGFAHGYLVGQGYLKYLRESVASVPADKRAVFDKVRSALRYAIRVPDDAMEELIGIFKGIEAVSGGAPKIEGLNRTLRLDDLVLHNAGDTLRAFGCSGFTVWGDKAGGAGVITTRNFDFPVPGPDSLEQQLILVRRPAGKRSIATVTFPAYIGVFTGVNIDGVCAFMHDGTGRMIHLPNGKYLPVALVLKDLLETGEPGNAHALAKKLLRRVVPYPFSYMIRVVTPRVPGRIDTPVHVFRVDASGLSENGLGDFACITTNHYLDARLVPADGARESSLHRYKTLKRRLTGGMTEHGAWEALGAVASRNPGNPTLHSLVVYPEKRRVDLAFAVWKDGVVSAASQPRTTITFKQLFAPHD